MGKTAKSHDTINVSPKLIDKKKTTICCVFCLIMVAYWQYSTPVFASFENSKRVLSFQKSLNKRFEQIFKYMLTYYS